jgi:MFS family permease
MTRLSQYTLVISAASCVFITLGLNHTQGLFLLPMSEKLNTGRELFSLAGGLGVLFSGLFAPIFGGFADKFGAGKALTILSLLQLISWVWLGNIETNFDLLGARILLGIGASAILGIALSVTGKFVSRHYNGLRILGTICCCANY